MIAPSVTGSRGVVPRVAPTVVVTRAASESSLICSAVMRCLAALVAVALSIACKKDASEQTAAQAQAQTDAHARVQQLCDGMNDLSLLYVAGLVEQEVESLDADPGARTRLRVACKELPLTVVECADRLAIDDPTCDAALEKQLGMTDSRPQGDGPEPSWSLQTPFEVYDLDVAPDGRIALAGEKALAVVVDGKLAWSVELPDASARVAWAKGCVLTGVRAELRCLGDDGDGGEPGWSIRVVQGDGDHDDHWISAIEPGPEDRFTVVTSRGTIVRIDEAKCASTAEGCVTTIATVEALGGAAIEVLPSGAILGSNDAGVALVSPTGTLLARKAADYEASLPRNGLVVVGREVLRANPQCQPQADDCFAVIASDADMELVAPVELPGVGLAYTDTYGVIHMVGATQWQIDAGNDGDLLTDGTTLYSVGHQLGLGDALKAPPQLRAIDPRSGRTRWITPLGTGRAGLLSGYIVALHESGVLVSTKSQLFSVPVGEG